ncbi:hypothetical protein ACQPZJ_44820 [Actinoplanes sp. CA-054009]
MTDPSPRTVEQLQVNDYVRATGTLPDGRTRTITGYVADRTADKITLSAYPDGEGPTTTLTVPPDATVPITVAPALTDVTLWKHRITGAPQADPTIEALAAGELIRDYERAHRVRERIGEITAAATTLTDDVSRLALLSPLAQAQLRVAVEDHGPGIINNPDFRPDQLGRIDYGPVGRYVTEGYLRDLHARYGFGLIWEAVEEYARDAHEREQILTRTPRQVSEYAQHRARICAEHADAAGTALKAGDFATAYDRLDQGQLTDPGYRHRSRQYSWDDLRAIVARRELAEAPGTAAPDNDQNRVSRDGTTQPDPSDLPPLVRDAPAGAQRPEKTPATPDDELPEVRASIVGPVRLVRGTPFTVRRGGSLIDEHGGHADVLAATFAVSGEDYTETVIWVRDRDLTVRRLVHPSGDRVSYVAPQERTDGFTLPATPDDLMLRAIVEAIQDNDGHLDPVTAGPALHQGWADHDSRITPEGRRAARAAIANRDTGLNPARKYLDLIDSYDAHRSRQVREPISEPDPEPGTWIRYEDRLTATTGARTSVTAAAQRTPDGLRRGDVIALPGRPDPDTITGVTATRATTPARILPVGKRLLHLDTGHSVVVDHDTDIEVVSRAHIDPFLADSRIGTRHSYIPVTADAATCAECGQADSGTHRHRDTRPRQPTALTDTDRRRIEVAAEDLAPGLISEMGRHPRTLAHQIIAERLARLADRYGHDTVADVIVDLISDPQLGQQWPAALRARTEARTIELATENVAAGTLLVQGDTRGALVVLERINALDPDYLAAGATLGDLKAEGASLADLRQYLLVAANRKLPADEPVTATPREQPAAFAAGAGEQSTAVPDADDRPAGPDHDLPAAPPAATSGALAEFTALEQARIRVKVEDRAGQYASSPMIGKNPDAIGRYIGEGDSLNDIAPGERWKRVAAAARQILADRPDLMDLDTPQKREAYAAERATQAEQVLAVADAAFNAGDFQRALDLLDRAELIDPDHRPFGDGTWQQLRAVVEGKRADEAAPEATGTPELSAADHDEQPGLAASNTDRPEPSPSGPDPQTEAATGDTATLPFEQPRPGGPVLPYPHSATPMNYQVGTAHRLLNGATDTIDLAWAAGAILIHPEKLPHLLTNPSAVFRIGADLVRADQVIPLHAATGPQRYLHVDTRSRTLAVLTEVTATSAGYVPASPPLLSVPTAELEQLLAAVPEPLAARVHTAAARLAALDQQRAAATTSQRLRDPAGNDAWHRWRPAYQLQRTQIIRELHHAAATVWRTIRPGTHGRTYENHLLQQTVDAVPDNVIDHDEQGNPTVLLAHAARDVYGTITGTDVHGAPLTATGYLTDVRQYPGHTVLTARLANEPGNDPLRADALLRVGLDARITVLPRPGERDIDTSRPVLALPEVEQILATRDQLGWTVEVTERVVGARRLPIWAVGDTEPVTPLLDMIRGGTSGSGRSAWRADFAQRWIDQAIAVGTYRPVGVLDADNRLMLPAASDAGRPDQPDTTQAVLEPDHPDAPPDDPGELDALFALPTTDGTPAEGRTPLASVHTKVQALRSINEPGQYGPYGEFTGTPCRWDGAPNGAVVVPGGKQQSTTRGYLVRLDSWTGGIRVDNSTNTRYGQNPVWLAFVAPLPDIPPTAPGVQMITVAAGGTFTALPEPAEVQFPAAWPWRWSNRQRRERAQTILAGVLTARQTAAANQAASAAPAEPASVDLPAVLQPYDALDRVRILNAVQDYGDSPSPLDHDDAEAIGRFIAKHQLKGISARDGAETTAATVTAVLNARPDLMDQPAGHRGRVIVERRQRLRDLLAEHRQCANAGDVSGARAALDRMEQIDPDAFVAPDVPPREAEFEVRLAGGQRRIGERTLTISQMREALPADPVGGDLLWAAAALLLPKPEHVAAVLGGADPLTAGAKSGEIAISGGEDRRLIADAAAGQARLTDPDGNTIAEIPGTAITALLRAAAAHPSGIGSHLDTVLRRHESVTRQASKTARARSDGQDPAAPTNRVGQLAARAADAAVTEAVAGLWETASGITTAIADRTVSTAPPPAPASSHNDRAEERRDSIRRVAVNNGPALDELLTKIGNPKLAQAVVEDSARRYALGYPAVRKGRGDYSWSCPIPDCDTSRGDLLTTRDVRSMWLSHAARAHPAYTPGWDDITWPTTTAAPVVAAGQSDRIVHAGMPRVDDPAFGVHTARRRNAFALTLETGQPSLPNSLVDLTESQLAALDNAGDVYGMVYAVVAHRDTGKAMIVGPFIDADAAWTWWHVPVNKAVRHHDHTVLFTLLATPERETHWLYLQAEAHEIIANATRDTPRHLLVWAAGVHDATEARTITASWHRNTPGFTDNPNGGGNFRPQAGGPNRWLHRDRKGWHLTEDIPGEKIIFTAAWREITAQVSRDRLPAEVVRQLESAGAYGKATWLPSGDARRNDPEQREREQDADRQSGTAAATAWLAARTQPGDRVRGRNLEAATLFTTEGMDRPVAPVRSADPGQHVEHAAGSAGPPDADEPDTASDTASEALLHEQQQPQPKPHTHYVVFNRLGGGSKYGGNFEQATDFARHIETALPIDPVVAIATPNPGLEFEGWIVEVAHPHTDAETLQALRQQIQTIGEEQFGGVYDWSDGAELPDPDVDPIAEVDAALYRLKQADDTAERPSSTPAQAVSAVEQGPDDPATTSPAPAAAANSVEPAPAADQAHRVTPADADAIMSEPASGVEQLTLDFLFGIPTDHPPAAAPALAEQRGDQREPVRQTGDGALADQPQRRVPGATGPAGVLHQAGGGDRADDRGRGPRETGRDAGDAGVPAAGTADHRGADRGGERSAADPPARPQPAELAAAGETTPASRPRFRPAGQQDLAPSGEAARIHANLAAIRILTSGTPIGEQDQQMLARWSGWGAVPALFDERPQYAAMYAAQRAELRELVGDDGYRAARRTTLNAHYTDAAYVQIIWAAVQQLGFTGRTALEPGCGAGSFIGFAPSGTRMIGIERDPTTAAIAQALYPDAQIHAESFADTRIEPGSADLAIGNVPFGKQKLHDRVHNPDRTHSIHNHFILKSLHTVRPGGLVALITSRYTLDGRDDAHQRARDQMAALAALVAAIRLPSSAHKVAAGTEVVTDLLILRRRDGDPADPDPAWTHTRAVTVPHASRPGTDETFTVNDHFLQNPHMVLGTMAADTGRNSATLTVRSDDPDTAAALRRALEQVVAAAAPAPTEGQAAAIGAVRDPRPVVLEAENEDLQEGRIVEGDDGKFYQVQAGALHRHEVPAKDIAELRALIGLRQTVMALLREESTHREDTDRMGELRAQLNEQYDGYLSAFRQPINRVKISIRTGTDKHGEPTEVAHHTYPEMGGFRTDPSFSYVAALEAYDKETGQATKKEIFFQRVIAPPTAVTRVAEPADALVICWDRHNQVRLDVIAGLLGLDTEQQARDALSTLVYEEPGTGELIRKAEYLSGNVRRKLTAARTAADLDSRFTVNVEALQRVVPRDKTPAEIGARLGSPWIAAGYVQQFLQELLDDDSVTVTEVAGHWSVSGGTKSILAGTVWGTSQRSAPSLAQNLLNSETIEITKTVKSPAGERTYRDTEATARAQAKAERLDARFRGWLWEEPERSTALSRIYNDRFNARVYRSYDGEHITAPGLSTAYPLRAHQMAAVARIREQKGAGLFHGTGAGKTLEMVVGGMELRRLGLANKPCYVVPKGVLDQFRREFQQAYPLAKVLAADSADLRGDKRRQFVARCSTGDWDAIIISHTAFKSIPVSKSIQTDYLNRQVDRLRAHLQSAEDADRHTVKDLEKQIATLEEEIQNVLDKPTDAGVQFELTGIDYLFIDEAQAYKNLRVISSIPDLKHPGNQITADMEMKLEYLRAAGRRRLVTLATATPIDNAPSELLTMVKYADPDLLTDMELETDDQFHAAFIQGRRRVEMKPDGSGFASRVRYSRYVNVPELKQNLLFSWADVKLKHHLNLGEPTIIGGKPEIITNQAPTELRQHLGLLAERARKVTSGKPDLRTTTKGELKKDNILWISTDGRKASLDLRLAGLITDEPQKVDVAADWLAQTWRQHRDDVYYQSDGTPEPIRGSLQLVFCDLGVPSDRWNIYEALRDELMARGMAAEQIRFAQEATTLRERAQLDQDARDGKIAVLIGSRSGLGTGRNIQRRVITVMQLDPTWKQSPLEQSVGRGQRQGNANQAIHHVFVVTVGSYDPFLWQKVDDKARFTRQMLDVSDTTRVIDVAEDDGSGKVDPAVMFAVAAGRDELSQLTTIEETVGALRIEQQIWYDDQYALTASIDHNQQQITSLQQNITGIDQVLARRRDTRGDAFTMTVGTSTLDKRAEAGEALADRLLTLARSGNTNIAATPVARLGGIEVTARVVRFTDGPEAIMTFSGLPQGSETEVAISVSDLLAIAAGKHDAVGVIRQLENRLAGLDKIRARHAERIQGLQDNIKQANQHIGLPFPQQADLDRYSQQLADLHAKLDISDSAGPDEAADETSASNAPPDVAAGLPETATETSSGTSRPAGTSAVTKPDSAAPERAPYSPPNPTSGDAPASAEPTPASTYHGPISLPNIWVVTVPGMPAGKPRTHLQVGPASPDAMLRHQGWNPDSDNPVTFDGHRYTVRLPNGDTFYNAQPLMLPWRALQRGEAAALDVGASGRWHFAEGSASDGVPFDLRDVRRALQAAETAGAPIAETDWGVVISHHRTQVFVRDGATIPAVPDVALPGQEPDTATEPTSIFTGLPDDQRRWLTRRLSDLAADEQIRAVARANSYQRASTVLDDRLDELIAEAGDDTTLPNGMALVAAYFDQPDFRAALLDGASRHLYAQARNADTPEASVDGEQPDATPPAPARDPAAASTRLAELLAERGVTEQQGDRLMEKINTLAVEDLTVARVRANEYDNFHLAITKPVWDLVLDVADEGDDGLDLYRKLTGGHGEALADEFLSAVSVYLYEVAAEPADPALAAKSPAVPSPAEATAGSIPSPDRNSGSEPRADGLPETQRRRRGHDFYPPAAILQQIPPLYATDGIPKAEKTIYLHYFGGSRDYWIAEYDPATGEAFGYGGTHSAVDGLEWGYSYLPELEELRHGLTIIERDLYWTPVRAADANLPGGAVEAEYRPEHAEPGRDTTAEEQSSVAELPEGDDEAPRPALEPGDAASDVHSDPPRPGRETTPVAEPAPIRVDQLRGGEHVYVCGIDKYGSRSYSTGRVESPLAQVSVAGRTATGRVSRSPKKARPGLLVTLATSEQSQMPIITGLDGFAEPVTDAAHQFRPTASDLPHLVHGHCLCGWKRGPGASTYQSERNAWAQHAEQQNSPPTDVPQVAAGLLEQAERFGRTAYEQGRPSAPGADEQTMALVAGWPVGTGADQVFEAFSHGYTAAADRAAAEVLDTPATVTSSMPADEPRVWTFPSTEQAYTAVNTAHTPDDVRTGDILHVPEEQVVGFAHQAWPVAVTAISGDLHGGDLIALAGTGYARSIRTARELARTHGYQLASVAVEMTQDTFAPYAAEIAGCRCALCNAFTDASTDEAFPGGQALLEALLDGQHVPALVASDAVSDTAVIAPTSAAGQAPSPTRNRLPSQASSPPPPANGARPLVEPRQGESGQPQAGSVPAAEPAQGDLLNPQHPVGAASAAEAAPADVTSGGPERWPLELRDPGWDTLDYQIEDAKRLLLGEPTADEIAWAAAVTMADSFRLSDIVLGADQEIGRGGALDRHEYTYYLGLGGTDVRRTLKADPASRQVYLLPEDAHGLLGRVDPLAAVPVSAVKAVVSRIAGPAATRLHAAIDAFRRLEARADRSTSGTSVDDRAKWAAWHHWKPSYDLLHEALVTEVKAAAAAAWRSARPDTPDRTAENAVLAANVAAVLADVIAPDAQGRPAVLLAHASTGVRGEVTGYDRDGRPVTAAGYLISQRIKTGGLGDAFPGEQMRVVVLQEQPGSFTQENALAVVQTEDDARITLIDAPDVGMPGFPYPIPVLRMAEAEQIVAARDILGWQIEATGSGDNLQWHIRGERLSTEQALVLLRGSGADAAAGAWAPGFAQRWIEEATAAGTYRPVGVLGADGTRRMPVATDTGVAPPPDLTEPGPPDRWFTAARDGLDEVRAVLARSRNLGTQVILPNQPLSRSVWEAVHATLTGMGATGGSRIGQPYRFDTSRYDELTAFLAGGPAPKHERSTVGWVPTPDPLAADVVARFAELDRLPRPLRVLEPSAGDGSLIRAVLAAAPDAEVTAVEPNPERAGAITAELATHVQHLHTLTIEEYAALWRQRNDPPYELIVMNPPYSVPGNRTIWADHVRLAWSMLAEGGRLVAVLPGRPDQRSDKRSTDLMALLSTDTIVEALPAKSFHTSGTDFDTSVLAVTRPVTDVGRARARYAASLYRLAEGEPVPVDEPKLTVRDAAETPVQSYRDFSGERVARYVGTCVLCSAPTWSDGSNDPRGMLGANAVQTLRADEHDLDGPDVCRCGPCASTAQTYDRSVARARTMWTTPVPSPDDISLDASIQVEQTDAALAAPQSGQAPDPAQTSADLPDGTAPSADAADPGHEPAPTEEGALSELQRQLLTELAKERGEPWSIGRQWRLTTFQKATANDVDALPPAQSEALRADLRASLDSPDFRERAIARTTLHAWSGTVPSLSDAQQQALNALTHYDVPATAAVDRYGQLTAEEYLALGDDDRADITADLKTIAASGATKTIPRNRTTYGTTIRGVDADHVSAARYLLGSIGRGVKPHRFHQHSDKVGRTVAALHLNPGDQIKVRGTVLTVDRIGIDDNIRLTGAKGATLKNPTSRVRLVAAAPEPITAATSLPDALNTDIAASSREPETPAAEQDPASGQQTLFQDPADLSAHPDTTTPQPAAEPEPHTAASTPRTEHGPSTTAETGQHHPSAAEAAPNLPASIGAPGRASGPGAPRQGPAQSNGADGGGPADAGRGTKQVRDPDPAITPDAPPERATGAAPADQPDPAPRSDTVAADASDPDPSTEATNMPTSPAPGAQVLGHIDVINDSGIARVTSSPPATSTNAETTVGVVAAAEPADTSSPASVTSAAERAPRSEAAPVGPVAGQPTPANPVPRRVADQIQQEESPEPGTAITTPERDQLFEPNRSAAEDAIQPEAPNTDRVSPRPGSPTPAPENPLHDRTEKEDPAATASASTSSTDRTDAETSDPDSDVLDTQRTVSATPASQHADAAPANPTEPAGDSRLQLAEASELVAASPHMSAPNASPEPRIEETVSTDQQDIAAAEAPAAQDGTAERHSAATTAGPGASRAAGAQAEASADAETDQQINDPVSMWQQARLTLADHTNAPENHLAWALAATAIGAGAEDGNWWIASERSTAPVIDGVIEGHVNEHLRFRADKGGARLERTQDGTVVFAADWNRLLRILAPEQATALAAVTKAAADARRRLIEFATVPRELMTQLQQKLTTRWEAARNLALRTIGRIWSAVKAALPAREPATVEQKGDQPAETDLLRGKAEPDRVLPAVRNREANTAPEHPSHDQGDVPTTGSNDASATSVAADSSDDRVEPSPIRAIDLAHIRLVVIDTAAEYFDSSRGFGIAGTAVHLAQHHLKGESEQFGLIPVVQAAADAMHQDESILTRSAEQRQTARRDRNAQSEMFADLIRSLAGTGNDEAALRLVAEAELLNPRHRTTWDEGPDLGWDEVSDRIHSRPHPAAQAFAPAPGGTPATTSRPTRGGPGQAFTAAANRAAPAPRIRPANPPEPTPAGGRRHR